MKSAGSLVCIFLALQAAGAAAQAFVCSSDADCAFSVTNQNGLFCAPNNFCNCCRSGPPATPAPTTGGGPPSTPAPTTAPGTPGPPPTNNGQRVSGITYQPFAPGSSICRDLGSLNVHLNQMRELADNIRIYSISVCPAQTDRILQFAEANGMKVVLGLFINNDGGNNEREINQLPALLSRYSSTIMEVSVGNEALFVLKVPYDTLVGYIRRAKGMRDAAGVNIPVSTAEVWPTWESDTGLQLVQEVDTIHMNMQPFWEGFYVTCPAGLPYPCANAGDYVWLKADGLQGFFGKPLLVTETGWPSEPAQESCCDGTRDNALSGLHAVPSIDSARTFWSQVISGGQQRGRPYFMHTFADEEWKRQWAPCTECRGLNTCLNGNQCELEYHWGRKTSNLQFKW